MSLINVYIKGVKKSPYVVSQTVYFLNPKTEKKILLQFSGCRLHEYTAKKRLRHSKQKLPVSLLWMAEKEGR